MRSQGGKSRDGPRPPGARRRQVPQVVAPERQTRRVQGDGEGELSRREVLGASGGWRVMAPGRPGVVPHAFGTNASAIAERTAATSGPALACSCHTPRIAALPGERDDPEAMITQARPPPPSAA